MPINDKTPGIRKEGTYPMMVVEICRDPSKAGNKMLTVQWKSLDPDNPGAARQWMVMSGKGAEWGAKAFAHHKIIAGLAPTALGEELVGTKAMVTLRLKAPDDKGKQYTEIERVEKFEVGAKAQTKETESADIPF